MSKVIQAGIVTAYGAAVRGGYTGTYDKFCSDLAELADVLSEFLGFSVTIETLNEGTQATASYNDGVLALGIPRGNTGNGIQRIERISTQGLVKTYRITYTNGNHFDFSVSDGNGIDHTTLNADYTLTITYTDGTTWTSGSIRGATGATPNLTIGTVTTLAPSEDATAEITGTPENPVLNLGLPKGDPGEVTQAEFDDLSETVTDLNRQISESITPAIEEIETALDGKAPAIYETASGDIASFADGADGMPIKSLVANIEPVQDLHGYDNPWPAGGGENKLPIQNTTQTLSGVTFTPNIDDDGNVVSITMNGTATDTIRYRIADVNAGWSGLISDSYVISKSGGSSGSFCFSAYNDQIWVADAYGADVTVSSAITRIVIYVWSGATLNNVVVKPMIRLATETDATFAPYSNICPISGLTGAELTRTGKNLLNQDGTNTDNGYRHGMYISAWGGEPRSDEGIWDILEYTPVKPSTTYTISGQTANNANGFAFYDSSKQFLSAIVVNTSPYTFTTPANCYYIRCNRRTTTDTAMQIELGSTATSYEPYTGNQISITFPSSAGTVYGGTLDVTNGVLTVDRAMVDLGTLNWTKVASSNYKTFVGDLNTMRYVYNEKTVMSSAYVGTSGQDATASADNYVWVDSRNTIAIKDTSKADMSASEFKTAMSGVQLVYELATPVTYQLTPQQLDTLLGTNNIWTDVGTVDVEYPADTKLYIDGKIATAIANALNA